MIFFKWKSLVFGESKYKATELKLSGNWYFGLHRFSVYSVDGFRFSDRVECAMLYNYILCEIQKAWNLELTQFPLKFCSTSRNIKHIHSHFQQNRMTKWQNSCAVNHIWNIATKWKLFVKFENQDCNFCPIIVLTRKPKWKRENWAKSFNFINTAKVWIAVTPSLCAKKTSTTTKNFRCV